MFKNVRVPAVESGTAWRVRVADLLEAGMGASLPLVTAAKNVARRVERPQREPESQQGLGAVKERRRVR